MIKAVIGGLVWERALALPGAPRHVMNQSHRVAYPALQLTPMEDAMRYKVLAPLALLALITACTTAPTPSDDAVDPGHITGTVEAYDLGQGELSATTFGETEAVTVGSGSIQASGDFTFTFADDPVEVALRPLADLFATPNCTDWDISDNQARGFWLDQLNLVKGGRAEGILMRTTRKEVLLNGPGVGDATARWFYADREVSARGECVDLSYIALDLDLERGWNVVTAHYDSGSSVRVVTGAPPAGLRWFALKRPEGLTAP